MQLKFQLLIWIFNNLDLDILLTWNFTQMNLKFDLLSTWSEYEVTNNFPHNLQYLLIWLQINSVKNFNEKFS